MDDAVAVAPEIVAARARRLRDEPPAAEGRIGGIRRARAVLSMAMQTSTGARELTERAGALNYRT